MDLLQIATKKDLNVTKEKNVDDFFALREVSDGLSNSDKEYKEALVTNPHIQYSLERDGWNKLVYFSVKAIFKELKPRFILNKNPKEDYHYIYIKEKLGHLRIQCLTHPIPTKVTKHIEMAHFVSKQICYNCGSVNSVDLFVDKKGILHNFCVCCQLQHESSLSKGTSVHNRNPI